MYLGPQFQVTNVYIRNMLYTCSFIYRHVALFIAPNVYMFLFHISGEAEPTPWSRKVHEIVAATQLVKFLIFLSMDEWVD